MLMGRGLEALSPNCLSDDEKELNISDNDFRSLSTLYFLPNLEQIIADNNYLNENLDLPKMPHLTTLSLNKNQINNLEYLLNLLVERTPKLQMLSMLGNPVSPDPIYGHLRRLSKINSVDTEEVYDALSILNEPEFNDNRDDEGEYKRYRLRILYRLPNLKFLDSTKVSEEERIEAKRRGEFLIMKTLNHGSESHVGKGPGALSSLASGITTWLPSNVSSKPAENSLSPLAEPVKADTSRVSYGKNQYIYQGRFSEGNRFLKDNDL